MRHGMDESNCLIDERLRSRSPSTEQNLGNIAKGKRTKHKEGELILPLVQKDRIYLHSLGQQRIFR